ncbi:type II secretion system protein [candidate division WWE3 bacterium]|nr:type II secretion system protein [candidate division WWE3 bacterium]
MQLPKSQRVSHGFTLIELLIAIVVIGVLAGVLIALINPTAQRNRAADAGAKATLNKIALSAEGYVSSYGSAPDEVQLIGSLQNVTAFGTTCSTGGAYDCLFDVNGNTLSQTCGANGWAGSGTGQCYYRYLSSASSTGFKVYAKSFGISNAVFMYDNQLGRIQHCDVNGSNCVNP